MFSLRKLLYSLTCPSTFTLRVLLFLFLLPAPPMYRGNDRYGPNGNNNGRGKSFMVVAADAEAEAKVKQLFVADIKKLLTHNQVFYNSYGYKDDDVEWAFEDARLAAELIYLYPDIFRGKLQNINYRIKEAIAKGQKKEAETETTADGVPVVFLDKYLLVLNVMGGMIRFPEW